MVCTARHGAFADRVVPLEELTQRELRIIIVKLTGGSRDGSHLNVLLKTSTTHRCLTGIAPLLITLVRLSILSQLRAQPLPLPHCLCLTRPAWSLGCELLTDRLAPLCWEVT